mmetsp:Transcript_20897/g.46838  ORF Transcript_20897/g.46838 Transcript_20897/m.46838 type:complete len:232 (-) Transcript_20897:73-768(-)
MVVPHLRLELRALERRELLRVGGAHGGHLLLLRPVQRAAHTKRGAAEELGAGALREERGAAAQQHPAPLRERAARDGERVSQLLQQLGRQARAHKELSEVGHPLGGARFCGWRYALGLGATVVAQHAAGEQPKEQQGLRKLGRHGSTAAELVADLVEVGGQRDRRDCGRCSARHIAHLAVRRHELRRAQRGHASAAHAFGEHARRCLAQAQVGTRHGAPELAEHLLRFQPA